MPIRCAFWKHCGLNVPCYSHRKAFKELWDSIYKEQGDGWDVNPWVWVVEFKKLEATC